METSSPRRVPVLLYVCTGDQDAADLLTNYCRQYATARDWDVIETVTDPDRQIPLMSRPGWTRVRKALSDNTARGVVTYSTGMIAEPTAEYEAVATLLRDRDAFLAAARPHTRDSEQPRRTPLQRERRRNIADASNEGCGSDWGMFL
ncbi:hypothetical protein [Streptomyces violascens]|uniref:hypothetical protein n=1 Tax=Streptomyces violascens TaxID=67381 RepID=UPI00167348BB|nr:hypothetical protein [Streptomyces violascens]